MNKFSLLLVAFLVGCAVAPYNPVEHWEIATLNEAVADHSVCNHPEQMPAHSKNINTYAKRIYRYSSDQPNNDQLRITLGLVKDSTAEFAKRYESEPYPSKRYCEDKLMNIEAILIQARKQAAEKPNK